VIRMYNIKGNETCLRIIIYYTYRVRVVAHVACIYNIIYNNNSRCIYVCVCVCMCNVHVHQSPERERPWWQSIENERERERESSIKV
jgi:hypothetical protein